MAPLRPTVSISVVWRRGKRMCFPLGLDEVQGGLLRAEGAYLGCENDL